MKTKLQEGTWYIRGCKGLAKYFKKNDISFYGDSYKIGYYIENGKWECSNIDYIQHRKEITLQDYLDSLEPQSFDELDLEIEEKEKGSIEFLKSRGYFVFPKAEEGDFPDLSGLDGVEMEMISDANGKKGWINCKVFYKFPKTLNNHYIFCCYPHNSMDVRPTQKQKLTLAELAEKAGLDINNIEIIE